MTASLEILSDVIGWLYTVAWSASFYPQVWLNYTRKSVTGLSFEYQAYNITGFTFYCIYSLTNYIVQHDPSLNLTQSVEVNDLVFVFHAIVFTLIIIYQCYLYKLKTHHLNRIHLGLVCVFWILAAYTVALCIGGILPFVNKTQNYQYSVVEYLGYVKVCISFIKYCPQAYMNWSRQSTVGWSIGNVLLDLSGGLLAFSQQAIEAYRKGSTSEFTSNIAKLLLSVESVGFDLLFIVQHYVLYRGNNAAAYATASLSKEEQEALEASTQATAARHAALLIPDAILRKTSVGEQAYAPVEPTGHGSYGARNVNNTGDPTLDSALDMNALSHSQRSGERLLGSARRHSEASEF